MKRRIVDWVRRRARQAIAPEPKRGVPRQSKDRVTLVKCSELREGDLVRELDSDGPFSPIARFHDHESMRDLHLENGTVIESWRYGLPLEVRGWRGGLTGMESQDGEEKW